MIKFITGYRNENHPTDIGYAQKSLVYKEIFKKLDLSNWLHGNDGQFERFAISGVTTAELVGYLTLLTKSLVTEMDAKSPKIRPVQSRKSR